jgi:hypothetical protein
LEFGLVWTVMVEVPEPGAAMGLGLKVTVLPGPCPEADRSIGELKPPEIFVLTVKVADCPEKTAFNPGDALTLKLPAAGAVTVMETVVVAVMLPEVPVTVMA